MEKSLEKVLRENRERMQQRKREEIKRLKREQRKETILAWIVAAFILVATGMLMYNIAKGDKDFLNDCMVAGHTRSYCEKGM